MAARKKTPLARKTQARKARISPVALAKAPPKKDSGPAKYESAPRIEAGVEPSVRVYSEWTPDLIKAAELAANNGNLRLVASLCEWILGDDRAGSVLLGRAESLLGLEPSFDASGDARRSGRAVRAIQAEEDWWKGYPDDELILIVVWGILLGVSPARHNWIRDKKTGRLLPRPEFWHPQHLRFDPLTRKWMIAVDTTGSGFSATEQELVPGDSAWLLHRPYGARRPWSMGLWRGLSRLCLLKSYAIGDWQRHGARGAVLALTNGATNQTTNAAQVQRGTVEQRRQLAADIAARGREAVIALPDGFDLKLVEARANTRDIYEAQLNFANTAIAVAVRGGNLTTEVQVGSFAATEAQERLGDQAKRRFDAGRLADTLHTQSLSWWAQYNFGDPDLAPWPNYPVDQRENLKTKADTMKVAMDGISVAVGLGFDVDQEKFAEQFELNEFLKPGSGPLKLPPTTTAAPASKDTTPAKEDRVPA